MNVRAAWPCDERPHGAAARTAAALFALAASLILTPDAVAAGAPPGDAAVLAQLGTEGDADEFDSLRARGGWLFDYGSHLQYAGVALQDTRYAQNGWSINVPGVIGLYRHQQRDTLQGVNVEAGIVSVSGKARAVGDATWSLRPREPTGIELIAAGDVVGTREALEKSIAYGLAAASIEQQFGERLTAIALAGWQPFTDGNSRTVFRARMIGSLWPEQGIALQARWRQYWSSKSDVGGAYYNPESYRNWDAGLSVRHRVGSWTVSGLAGAGRELSSNSSWQTTSIAEVRAEGPLGGNVRLALAALYNRAAGFADSSDYWYSAVSANVIIPLGR